MNILLADPDKEFVKEILDSWSYSDTPLAAITEGSDVISWCEQGDISLCFLSTHFLILHDLDMISYIKEHNAGIEIVILCDSKSVQQAENALSRGAGSYLLKPMNALVLENTARKVAQRSHTQKNYRLMEDHVLEDLLGETPEMKKILRMLYKVAPTNSTLLITGESGTGKEFISNVIHRLSKRSDGPFVTVNCGAIPENIVESELFGTRKGAYTGAVANKKGLFEEAEGGTLFLDEIGELSLSTQVKLLRFLQSKEIRRVGETENRYLDVRILAATNRDLNKAIAQGDFREDLFYRLNTFHFTMPPLRERAETIPKLVKFFILKYQQEIGKQINQITPAAQVALTTYDYPGNIRELENAIEHAVVLAEDEQIRLEDLPETMHPKQKTLLLSNASSHSLTYQKENEDTPFDKNSQECCPEFNAESVATLHNNAPQTIELQSPSPSNHEIISLAEMEKRHIQMALEALGHNQTEVAKRLGISRSTLWRKLQDHKISLT